MAVATGATFRYQPPAGLGAVHGRPTSAAFRAAEQLHARLAQLGIGPATVVTDVGDETVDRHRLKLIGWLDGDGLPVVTSICLQVFVDNFRRVVPA